MEPSRQTRLTGTPVGFRGGNGQHAIDFIHQLEKTGFDDFEQVCRNTGARTVTVHRVQRLFFEAIFDYQPQCRIATDIHFATDTIEQLAFAEVDDWLNNRRRPEMTVR